MGSRQLADIHNQSLAEHRPHGPYRRCFYPAFRRVCIMLRCTYHDSCRAKGEGEGTKGRKEEEGREGRKYQVPCWGGGGKKGGVSTRQNRDMTNHHAVVEIFFFLG